ncbi:MAG: GxxExxY protein [Chloroflexota bacterium]|nr:GxxExxY protein [Chloroflexota bacterium]
MLHEELTSEIINTFYTVYNDLGYGFLEKVYETALLHELRKRGIQAQRQIPIKVYYDGVIVGEYFADILVDGKVILELKAAKVISKGHKAQLINYLKATGIEVGLIMNFGPKPTFERRVFTKKKFKNPRKSARSA